MKLLEALPHVSPFKPPFSEVAIVEEPLELLLVYVDFCLGGCNVVVSFSVSFDVGKEPPVTKFSDGLPECIVSRQGPNEGIAKP